MTFSNKVNNLLQKLNFTKEEYDYFIYLVTPIVNHDEFQRRLTKEFCHHDDITTGEHILMVALVAYKTALEHVSLDSESRNDFLRNVILISMFHDLYTLPWQNNPENSDHGLANKHGFRHPIEGAINSISWFPEYFENTKNNYILIDGIIHHMFPLPVRAVDGTDMEIKNQKLYDKLDEKYKKQIILSSNKCKIGKFSIALSEFKEGRIMQFADKYVACGIDIKNLSSLAALVTGKNKKLVNKMK